MYSVQQRRRLAGRLGGLPIGLSLLRHEVQRDGSHAARRYPWNSESQFHPTCQGTAISVKRQNRTPTLHAPRNQGQHKGGGRNKAFPATERHRLG